jgi:hypothetical protein
MLSARSRSVRWSSFKLSGMGGRIVAVAALLGAIALGCPTRSSIPGEALGTFKFQATTQIPSGCPFEELPVDGGFEFTGIFSVVDGGPEAYLTVLDTSRRGTFDGQRFESTHPSLAEPGVPRTFEVDGGACENRFAVHETVRVVLLTEEQYGALQNRCSPDGGVEGAEALFDAGGPVDPDAGILPPARGPNGLDAAHACGLLLEQVGPADAGCVFAPCSIVFTLEGTPTK